MHFSVVMHKSLNTYIITRLSQRAYEQLLHDPSILCYVLFKKIQLVIKIMA